MWKFAFLSITAALSISNFAIAGRFQKCEEVEGRIAPDWPVLHRGTPPEYTCFAGQTPVVVTDEGAATFQERPISEVTVGDFVLSSTYIADGPSTKLVPCWDRVTAVKGHQVGVNKSIQVVSVDKGNSTDYRFYALTTPDHHFLVNRQSQAEQLDLVWVPAGKLSFNSKLVNLNDSQAGRPRFSENGQRQSRGAYVYSSETGDSGRQAWLVGDSGVTALYDITTETTHSFFIWGLSHPQSQHPGSCGLIMVHNKW